MSKNKKSDSGKAGSDVKRSYQEAKKQWKDSAESSPARDYSFETVSGVTNKLVYGPEDFDGDNFMEDLGMPGQYPYTRGIHPNMYRGKLWTMRQFAGYGTPKETNQRFKYLLNAGQTGLSVAFDMPTLMGYDADHSLSQGEVGKCGVNVTSLKDMEALFDGIRLDEISTSMTINGPASVLLAFYIAVAKKQGVDLADLRGTLQNDILKEYIAQKEFIYPPEPSMRLIVDTIEYCTENIPKWNPISISGYHIREAGSTAAQELAYTLADGFTYVEWALERGLDIDDFAPRLSFFFNSHLDFFEEVAKYRAARRIWAWQMKEKYGAKDERSMKLRFHTQTAGCTLTAQQPEINIARTAFQGLAGVLGGTQSLHTNSMDETLGLPTEKAAEIALRTQQLIAYETGVPNVVDPLGGSYYVESLTDKLEEQAEDIFAEIESFGGVIEAIRRGYFQKEIARSSYEYQKKVDSGERIIVGVNEFVKEGEELEIPILEIDEQAERQQRQSVRDLKDTRDQAAVDRALEKLRTVCETDENTMPYIINAAEQYATLGEITDLMKEVFGEYTEETVF
ncbi:MAG: methylmalonyl-CoA mutase family protein [Candidatus Marinimicrobia bacterium]|nr:methylmalonyl-CoA mutase family protein [Candidatus Neomarinimicrobiota bacterium]MCF7828996.1 methylmalonyl-CoA mutase family protein [Candidatus Neomarinimicrobiota bacterium]MCF7879956.1 methylmalonyl-CoA mutase family protein [Candidatus Neomarinimicrobiota bacterium]